MTNQHELDQASNCRALHLAIIDQAIVDYRTSTAMKSEVKQREKERIKEDARKWLFDDRFKKSFGTTCDYASVDQEYVRECAKEGNNINCKSSLNSIRI